MAPRGRKVSHSMICLMAPAFQWPPGRKYSSPKSMWESAAYETMELPSALAPGVTMTLVQALERLQTNSAAAARVKQISDLDFI